MKCCVCNKKSGTVHLTEIIGDEVQKLVLCEPCATARGISQSTSFSLSEMILGPKTPPAPIVLGNVDLRLLFNPLVRQRWLVEAVK